MPDIPDFTFKGGNFPMASVIEAAQRKAQLEQQNRDQGNKSLVEGLQAIGGIGQSLVDKRLKVAQALALGRQLGVPEDQARLMEPEQVLKAAAINKGNVSTDIVTEGLRRILGGTPHGVPPPGAAPLPSAVPASDQNAPAASNGAVLASGIPTTTPIPAAPSPGGVDQSSSTVPAQPSAPTPVPIPAPPSMPKTMSKANADMIFKIASANKQDKYVTPEEALSAGAEPHGTHVVTPAKNNNDPEGDKVQNDIESNLKSSMTILQRNSRGEYGIEDRKVGQARHLRQLMNKAFDPKTGSYNLTSALFNDLSLGMASLASPTGSPGVELLNALKQGTFKGDLGKALTYATGEPWNGSTQDILKLVLSNVDRQGETSEDNRNAIWERNKQINSIGLNPERYKKYEKLTPGLDYRSIYDNSPDKKMTPMPGGLSPEEQKFIDDYEAKHKVRT